MKKRRRAKRMTGKLKEPGVWCCAGAGALFVGFCSQWGSQLDNIGNVDVRAVSTWLVPLAAACILTPVLAVIFAWAGTGAGNRSRGRNQIQEKWESIRIVGWWRKQSFSTQLLLRAVALFACWFPVFLAVYPGFFAYDAAAELDEVVTGGYVTRHPLLHVLLLGKTVAKFHELTGSYNTGIVVYVVTQMTVMALLFSWVLEKLKKFGSGTVIGIISFLFLGFFPVIPMYALCTSKDTPYTAGMLAVLIILTDLCRGKKAFWSSPGKVLGLGAALLACDGGIQKQRSRRISAHGSGAFMAGGKRVPQEDGGCGSRCPCSVFRASGRTQCSAASGKYRCDGGLYSTYPAAGAGMEL